MICQRCKHKFEPIKKTGKFSFRIDCPSCKVSYADKPEQERVLFKLQEDWLVTKSELSLLKYSKYLERYIKSLMLKRFKTYIFSNADLQEKAKNTLANVLQLYMENSNYLVDSSFGGFLIKSPIPFTLFSKGGDFFSCKDYQYTKEFIIESVESSRMIYLPEIEKIKSTSVRIFTEINDKKVNIAVDKKGVISGIGEYDFISGGVDYKNASFFLTYDSDRLKGIKIYFKCISVMKVTGCELEPAHYADKEMHELNLQDIDPVDLFLEIIDYSATIVSVKNDLQRLIAIRNYILLGEESVDKFYSSTDLESKLLYTKTLKLLREIGGGYVKK